MFEGGITHLAQSPSMASAMLRWRTGAFVAAHGQHVEGRIGVVPMALRQLARQGIANFARERKPATASNLAVVLSRKGHTWPLLDTGKRRWDLAR